MASANALNERTHRALTRVQEVIAEHGASEQAERLTMITGPGGPPPTKMHPEFFCYLSEGLAALAEMCAQQAERQAEAPKKRGRPKANKAGQ